MISKTEIFSKEWANEQLSFTIQLLQGHVDRSSWKGKLQVALVIKKRLEEHGYFWQARRIENWIHRLQPSRADSVKSREEVP